VTSATTPRQIVITGGTGGLGQGLVRTLLTRPASPWGLIIPVFDPRELEDFPWQDDPRVTIRAGVDLRDEASVRNLYDGIEGLWASVHLVGGFAMTPLLDTGLAELDQMLQLNVATTFLTTREAARRMVFGGHGGRIVNVAARPALTPVAGMIAYATAKAGVVALTRSAAEELRAENILVNAIAPSIMDTPGNRAAMPDADHDSWPKVSEVAEAIAFLIAPENTLTTGLVMPVYGHV